MPAAPLDNMTMLYDYVPPEQRVVAIPNQDVAYGFGEFGQMYVSKPGCFTKNGWWLAPVHARSSS